MADTPRTKAELATLLADNAAGQISAQDVRDFLETMHPSYGSIYVTTPAETTINGTASFVKAAGTTADVNLHRVSGTTALAVDNRLRYDGTPTIHVHGVISFSMTIATGTNKVLELAAAKNGTVLDHSVVSRNAASTAVGTGALHFDTMMSTNDYVELWVRNTTDTTNIQIEHAYIFIMSMMV